MTFLSTSLEKPSTVSLALQSPCRSLRIYNGTSLATRLVMRKQNYISAALLLLSFLLISSSVLAQPRPVITRTALSRMSVLSRAEFFEKEIADVARRERVDPLILWAIAYNETRFRPWLRSPKNAQGLMQFMPATARRFGLADPYEPASSLQAAARYVRYLSGLFGGRPDSILAAYNSGEGTVLAYLQGKSILSNGRLINPSARQTTGGVPPYRETINYVSQGLRMYRWLKTQGRLPVNAVTDDETFAIDSGKAGKNVEKKAAAVTTVLYDPRSGRRFIVDEDKQNRPRPISDDGPVVISSEIRSLPAQKARSIFAGIPLRKQ